MFSFVTPIFKPKLDILEKCVKSLCDQSLKEWEAIFVFDGEDKEAESVVTKVMKKKPNHYKMITIDHGGACKARNEGFKHTKGEIVQFWDCDCIIEPHAAKAWVDIFEREPKIGFIYSSYKFLGERGALHSEPFDPWLLRVNNYISTCFPFRRELFPGWNEDLKSLQDWDFWLKIVEKGAVGKFMQGYAFSTAAPDKDSISGQGCTAEKWLERMDAVKKLHDIPDRQICVSSLANKQDGIALAKYLDADYRDVPNFHPHRYKTIIQVGFSLNPNRVQTHCGIFSDKDVKKVVFWTPDDIHEIWNRMSFNAIRKYSILLNSMSFQFVEDKTAKDMMTQAGFDVEIMPMPLKHEMELVPLPEKPRFAVDISGDYSDFFKIIDKSLPDVQLDVLSGQHSINEYTGLIHFFSDKSLSNSIKRALLTGRHVISNVQDPFAGFIDDNQTPEKFIKEFVNKVREQAQSPINHSARKYYQRECDKSRLLEAIK